MNAPRQWPQPARAPGRRGAGRFVEVGPGILQLHALRALPDRLSAGDVLVLNDAGTLPAALRATRGGEALELRLIGPVEGGRADAVVVGASPARTPTEARPSPPSLRVGDLLQLDAGMARVLRVDGRRVGLALGAGEVFEAGEPVRYSYLNADWPLGVFQTGFGGPAWSAEMPSAGRLWTWEALLAAQRRGVVLATLTHAAGLSSVDGGELDRTLPWPERCSLPEATVRAVEGARRVVAVGTTVLRALEGVHARFGRLVAGEHVLDLVIGPETRLAVVDGLVSNLHLPGSSHFELLRAFAAAERLEAALALAGEAGMEEHELGDGLWVWRGR